MTFLLRVLSRCIDFLFPISDTAFTVHDVSEVAFGRLLHPRAGDDGTTALLPYRHRLVRAVIIEAKFHNNKKAFFLLAGILKDYVEALTEETESLSPMYYVLVPIPLGEKRIRERGYNQVEEVIKATKLSYTSTLLKRSRETAPQTSLTRHRRIENMTDAFTVTEPIDHTKVYVLVDDVTTTGATLLSAKHALAEAGAHVLTVSLAY